MSIRGFWGFVVTTLVITRKPILLSRAVARVRRSTSQLAGIFVQSTSDIHPGRLIGWVVCCNPITLGEEASPDAGLFSGGRRAVAIPSLREK